MSSTQDCGYREITVTFMLVCVSGNSLISLREVPDIENYP